MQAILDRLKTVARCRRVRLLVAPDNVKARHLCDAAGFRPVGTLASTGEWVLQRVLRASRDLEWLLDVMLYAVASHARRVFRN